MKKITTKEASEFFKSRGCELLDDYKKSDLPLRYRCQCGIISTTTWARFRKGSLCYECGLKSAKEKKSLDGDMVALHFEREGCVLLEKYQNNYTPMKYRCSCGKESEIRYFAFKKGQRCDACDGGRGETHYRYNPNRDEVEYNRRFSRRQSSLLNAVLKAIGKNKRYKASEILGYSVKELKDHIQSHPNWNNVKDKEWHIDHIFPIKAFLDYGIDDVRLINCLENLQPLEATENLIKSDSYSVAEFEKWLLS